VTEAEQLPLAITLTQPWAQLVVGGQKLIETRSWSTRYRGRLLIHAAKDMPESARTFASDHGWAPDRMARGAIVGAVRLVDVLPVEHLSGKLTIQEIEYGDYSPGRYAWLLADHEELDVPIPTRGALGLWRYG
jgi:hypothetical protein